MKTIEVTADAFRAALHGTRPKRNALGGASLPRPAPTVRNQLGDWTEGKALKALKMGFQIGYDARQWTYAFRPGERTAAYARLDDLLKALEALGNAERRTQNDRRNDDEH